MLLDIQSKLVTERLNNAIEYAKINPLGIEILVDDVVRGGTFGQLSEGAKQIVRVNGDGTMSGYSKVMGSNYRPMSIKEFVRHVDDFRAAGGFGEPKYYLAPDGKRAFAFLPNEGKSWVLNGSQMDNSMIIATSFDGTMPLTIGGKTYFHRCENMFSNISKAVKIRNSKHKMDDHLINYKAEIGGFTNEMNEFYENAHKMMEIEVTPEIRQTVTKKLLGITPLADLSWDDEMLKEKAGVKGRTLSLLNDVNFSLDTEMKDLGNNAWGYFNGITHFTTHTKNKGEGHAVDAVSMKYNIKAYNELLAL